MKRFVCMAKCPELDNHMAQAHCIDTEEGIQQKQEISASGDYCPCGNVPKWEEIIEEPYSCEFWDEFEE